jgi:hypothetical protein
MCLVFEILSFQIACYAWTPAGAAPWILRKEIKIEKSYV